MQRQQQQGSRVDLADLKGEIVERVGSERSRLYFYYLNRLLTRKLSKNEFDKLCTRVIGKENLSLHNHLIHSILKNACDGKVPPTADEAGPSTKLAIEERLKNNSNVGLAQTVPWSNGVVSPKKSRTSIRDRKLKNRPGLIKSKGKLESASHLTNVVSDEGKGRIITQNGDVTLCDYQQPVQLSQGYNEPPISDRERDGFQRSLDIDDATYKDELSNFPLNAPLGVPFCKFSIGASQKPIPTGSVSNSSGSCSGSCTLPDTESLQKCMEQIAVTQGLEGVTTECANMLNRGLDVYLKRLIKSCINVVSGKSAKHVSQKQQVQSKLLNGLLPSNHQYMQNNGSPANTLPEHKPSCSMSVLDFRVAMELNPQQLGEDWPFHLEKISIDPFTE